MSSPRREIRKVRRHSILVHVEGITEDRYLKHIYRKNTASMTLTTVTKFSDPMSMVRAAAARRKSDVTDQKRGRGDAYDEYWCVFDIDQHPNLKNAIEMARANDIAIAISNPCIELWFLIHYEDQTAFISRGDVQAACQKVLGCEKGSLSAKALDELFNRYAEARERAKQLDRMHESADRSVPDDNPSSRLWELIDHIIG